MYSGTLSAEESHLVFGKTLVLVQRGSVTREVGHVIMAKKKKVIVYYKLIKKAGRKEEKREGERRRRIGRKGGRGRQRMSHRKLISVL